LAQGLRASKAGSGLELLTAPLSLAMAGQNLDFNPLEFFRDEINKDNTAEVRVNAVTNLPLIASALGAARVAEELIPFLNGEIGLPSSEGNSKDSPLANDDEFLFNMAKQYAGLRDYIKEDKIIILIKPLVHLAQQEETVIRDQAIKSLSDISQEKPHLVRAQVYEELKDMVKKPEFTTRVSACALFATVYKIHNKAAQTSATADEFAKVRADLCKSYKEMCFDDTPMVRRASANNLQDFVKELELEDLMGGVFLEAYKSLAKEETQDTIKVNVVNTTIEMARKLKDMDPQSGQEKNKEHTVPIIQELSKDRSWRVRLTIAKNFDKLVQNFGPEITTDFNLVDRLYDLLKDPEQEVRKEAIIIIDACLRIVWTEPQSVQFVNLGNILPEIVNLMGSDGTLLTDGAQPVRAALAQVMGPVAERAGKETTQRKLLPAITALMQDEFHGVRLNIVSHAGTFCDVLGVDQFVHSCLNTMQTLILDNHWRIRRSVVEQVPKLAAKFEVDMYQQKLESLFVSSLKDSVFSVRKEALSQLKSIADKFGKQWTAEHLLPKIMDLYAGNNNGYANRVTTLQALPQVWAGVADNPSASKSVIDLLSKALADAVPNVRLCACNVITELLVQLSTDSSAKAAFVKKLKPSLTELVTDSDSDVQFFSQLALNKCE